MLPSYVLLDLETTGATAASDRITEIALIRFEEDREVDRWQTLVNPGMPIPPFIQHLTGINDAMVENAPTFDEVAQQLQGYLDGAVLVAHNVRFDHSFLKKEYKRLGATLRQRVCCSVKLSRKLYPQYRSHGLDAIIDRHGIHCSARHRAMGDVEVLAAFLEVAKLELGSSHVSQIAGELMKGPSLPGGLDPAMLENIPESPGVYLFFGENNLSLYIGKCLDLQNQVMSHFSGNQARGKKMRMAQEVKQVEWIATAGEFGAQLLESQLIRQHQPMYNRFLRKENPLCSWHLAETPAQSPLLSLVYVEETAAADLNSMFGIYGSPRQAAAALRSIAESHALCPRLLGLETGEGPCFFHQLNRCHGVCCGKEKAEIHYLRLLQALAPQRLQTWPYSGKIGIREHDAETGLEQVHVFEQWCYLGTAESEQALHELLQGGAALKFNVDTYRLLLKEVKQGKRDLIEL